MVMNRMSHSVVRSHDLLLKRKNHKNVLDFVEKCLYLDRYVIVEDILIINSANLLHCATIVPFSIIIWSLSELTPY